MNVIENAINDLNTAKFILGNTQVTLTQELRIRIGQTINSAIALLEERETIFLKDGHHVRCTHCDEYWCDSDREGNQLPMNFCPNCGRKVKWE